MANKMLQVKNLMVFFENSLAINDLSLEVCEGEIVGVLGSNSAGKTTLMNTISGLMIDMKKKEDRRGGERITLVGELIFEGEDITHTKPSDRVRKGIGLSRERHPIFPDSSVGENLQIATYIRKDSEVRESFDFVYSVFPRLKALRKRKAGFCSGGEQQMLSIGMALMTRPRLLLMDEPYSDSRPPCSRTSLKPLSKFNPKGSPSWLQNSLLGPFCPLSNGAIS
jgi:branched-chain amino acid transport system ATP-binding protein